MTSTSSDTKRRIQERLQEIERESHELTRALDIIDEAPEIRKIIDLIDKFSNFPSEKKQEILLQPLQKLQHRVLDILKSSPGGLTANELTLKIQGVSRQSLAATLSRMKSKGLITNEKRRWNLITIELGA
jgi:hypothetical protein